MAVTMTGNIGVSVAGLNYNPGLAVGVGTYTFPAINQAAFIQGATAGKINLLAVSSGTAAASPASIDLTALTDPFGNAVNFARINGAVFLNDATTDGFNFLLDATVANAFKGFVNGITTAKVVVPNAWTDNNGNVIPGQVTFLGFNTTGFGAVSGSNKVVSLDPGANSVAYRILWLGR